MKLGDRVSIFRSGWDNAAGVITDIPDVAPWGTGRVHVVTLDGDGGGVLAFGEDELRLIVE